MSKCAILKCKNKSVSRNLTRGGISYHRFPSDPKLKAKWIAATGRRNWFPGKTATICSAHFKLNDFVIKGCGRHYLHYIAVPSRNVPAFQENPAMPLDVNCSKGTNSEKKSIEVEIMPGNDIIVTIHPPSPASLLKPYSVAMGTGTVPQTHTQDNGAMKLMQAKIQEQDLIIRKLKVRNYRLKQRLLSLKSMEIKSNI